MANTIPAGGISLSAFDWAAVVAYAAATGGIALWSYVRQRGTSEDYLLAGRSQGWFVVSVTLFAAIFSSISFVAIPGEAFRNGLLMSLLLIFMPLPAPLAIWLFLRFFFHSPTYTAYEYLERRFNAPTRVIGAVLFCVTRLIYSGVIYYAAAELFQSLVGWPPLLTILVIGFFTIAYTTVGGMKALIATDLMQSAVLVLGIGAVLLKVLSATGFDVAAIYRYAAANGHGYGEAATARFYAFNPRDRLNVWLLIWQVVSLALVSLSADQLVVQRLLTSKGYAGAKRAVLFKYFASVPLVMMFWAVGVGLFYYYGTRPGKLPAGLPADQVMGYFIGTELPSPIPGLIVAAMLAALMSTTSSVVTSVATVIYRDGLVRVGWAGGGADPRAEVRTCKVLSVIAGVAGVGFALLIVFGGSGVQGGVFEVNAVWGGLTTILMAAFLLGVLVPFVSGPAMVVGLVVGGAAGLVLPYVLYYSVPVEQRISFYWVGVPAVLIALLLPLPLSLIWPNRKPLDGLTLRTLRVRPEADPAAAAPREEMSGACVSQSP